MNAIGAVENTKEIIQDFRENGWAELLDKVGKFCKDHDIHVPCMDDVRQSSRGRLKKSNPVTLEHYFQIEIFTSTLDCILSEMNFRFNEKMMDLLKLCSALHPKSGYKSAAILEICGLVERFYPADFTKQEMLHLKYQLEHLDRDVEKNINFKNASLSELCHIFSERRISTNYNLIDRLIRLVLTLPVSTATSERAFSAMKIVKNRLRNKMADDFIQNSLIMYIEKDIVRSFDVDSIIDEFDVMKKRRARFK